MIIFKIRENTIVANSGNFAVFAKRLIVDEYLTPNHPIGMLDLILSFP